MAKGNKKRREKQKMKQNEAGASTGIQDSGNETPSTSTPANLQAAGSSGMNEDMNTETAKTRLEQSAKDIKIEYSQPMVLTPKLPPKQKPGILGRKVKLITNCYPIKLLPDGNIFHYDVKIIDIKRNKESELTVSAAIDDTKKYRCLSTKINRKVMDEMLKIDDNLKNSYAVYDGKYNLYTPSELKLTFPYECKVEIKDKKKFTSTSNNADVFKVVIKPVEKKDANNMKTNSCAISLYPLHRLFEGKEYNVADIQESVMALETIFRHTPAFRYIPIGRSFFHPTFNLENIHPLSEGVKIWFGYHQSLPLGQYKPMVNLNMTATTFFSQISLLKYIAELLNKNVRELQSQKLKGGDILKLTRQLKNVEIEVTHQASKRTYRIGRLTDSNADEIKLKNTEKTIHQYFREKYNKVLQYPHLPCIQVKPEERESYMPIEVCEIKGGQHCNKELKSKHLSQMIKVTAQAPKDRFNRINKIRNNFADYDHDEYLNQFNIEVDREPIGVEGRVLQAPSIKYSNAKFQPTNGVWDIRNRKFIDGREIKSICLLSLVGESTCKKEDLEKFLMQLNRISGFAGMRLERSCAIDIISEMDIRKKFRDIKMRNISLTVVVVPSKQKEPHKNKKLYQTIKQVAETEFGIITQCITEENVINCSASLLSNLCQKINAKMGGINHILTECEIPYVFDKPVIIMGADVSHPKITDENGVSIAAVVGSLNRDLTKFAVTCKLQKNKNQKKKSLEIIIDLKDMVKDLLLAFNRHTNLKPEKIIFYRDGVSEGQFSEVKEKEVTAIRDAWYELERQFKAPKITFAVVRKRHHKRFMPENIREGIGPMKNAEPGTVVDTDVVHPLHRDFYMISQNGIKGTSIPAYYTIIEDENEFTADKFQKLTYYLCYTFVRCSKSISCPAPVRYAHLAALHTRLYLPATEKQSKKQTAHNDKEELDPISKEILKAIVIPDEIKHKMYFV